MSESDYLGLVIDFFRSQGWQTSTTEVRDGVYVVSGIQDDDTTRMLTMVLDDCESQVTSDHLKFLLKAGKKKNADQLKLTAAFDLRDTVRETCAEHDIAVLDSANITDTQSHGFEGTVDDISMPSPESEAASDSRESIDAPPRESEPAETRDSEPQRGQQTQGGQGYEQPTGTRQHQTSGTPGDRRGAQTAATPTNPESAPPSDQSEANPTTGGRLSRRKLVGALAGLGIVGGWGWIVFSQRGAQPPGGTGGGDGGDSGVQTPNVPDTPTSTPKSTPTATPNPGPQPPSDVTYTVAKDGSGDYESLAQAMQVTQSGDVLKLKAGEYEWGPEINRSGTTFDSFAQRLTFIGEGPEETTLTITGENVKNNNVVAAKKPPTIFNTHLVTQGDVTFGMEYGAEQNGAIHRSRVDGRVRGDFSAFKTTFNGPLNVTGYLTQCVVNADFRFGDNFIAEETDFNSTVYAGRGDDGGGQFRNCVLNSGVAAPSRFNRTGPKIHNSVVKPMSNGVVFDMTRPGEDNKMETAVVTRSRIIGRIVNSAGKWVANEFVTGDQSFDYFIDDTGPRVMWGNVFKGADVRFSGGVKMYNESKQIGNYYAAWDGGKDDNSDGVSELPRPIPGPSDVVDQYPLMQADRSAYGLLSSS